MTQPTLWDASVSLPVSGQTPEARHASSRGAQVAAKTRGAVTLAYLELLKAYGPLSDHKAARMLGRQLSSINSVRDGCGALVVASGQYEDSEFGTKRVKWRLA